MADYSNAEIFAAWLLHATRVGENGRLLPTDAEISAILKADPKPPHFEEAHAIGQAFVKRVVDTEPRNIIDATVGFTKEIHRLQEKFGGFLSSPPAAKPKQIGGRR